MEMLEVRSFSVIMSRGQSELSVATAPGSSTIPVRRWPILVFCTRTDEPSLHFLHALPSAITVATLLNNSHYIPHTSKLPTSSSMATCLQKANTKFLKPRFCITVSCMQMLRTSSVLSGTQPISVAASGVNVLGLHMPRYDAHPMAILTSAFAYLGSYYSEANPSLQGKRLPHAFSCKV